MRLYAGQEHEACNASGQLIQAEYLPLSCLIFVLLCSCDIRASLDATVRVGRYDDDGGDARHLGADRSRGEEVEEEGGGEDRERSQPVLFVRRRRWWELAQNVAKASSFAPAHELPDEDEDDDYYESLGRSPQSLSRREEDSRQRVKRLRHAGSWQSLLVMLAMLDSSNGLYS